MMTEHETNLFKQAILDAYNWQLDDVTAYIDHEKHLISIKPKPKPTPHDLTHRRKPNAN